MVAVCSLLCHTDFMNTSSLGNSGGASERLSEQIVSVQRGRTMPTVEMLDRTPSKRHN
jgi:hypothetical protein